ncbi:MAG: aldehyde dehydrogenase [Acutalibacteraceae bacterium]
MTEAAIQKVVAAQRAYFETGETLDPARRKAWLKALKARLVAREDDLRAALQADLGKSQTESYMCEIGMTLSELSYMIPRIKRYAREKSVLTPLAQFAARSYVKPSPYGVCLIMSPWNYPVMLSLEPLVDALAAGNTVVLKPSAYSPQTSRLLGELLAACFPPELVSVVTGGREENQYLLQQPFDYIFFTGSQAVGKEVMRAASERLTPVTLELGGKSPCIIEKSADIPLAAKRVVFGKYLNCGQTCVAPDYILCEESVKDRFIAEVKKQIVLQFGEHPLENEQYGHIINQKHFERLCALINPDKVVCGGTADASSLKIEPTVMDRVTYEDAVMGEEIFGPIMPILTYRNIDDVIAHINAGASPLALYLFSADRSVIRRVTARCSFGGGCINDTIIHLATSRMGFGGVGESGMGAYHGKTGFDTFSHRKSIVDKKTFMDMPIRYQPYTAAKETLIRLFLK